MVEGRRQVGRVTRIFSERRAQLPAVNVLGALRWRSGALALIGVAGNVISQWWRALVGYSTDSRALRARAVGRMRGIRWVKFHRGHGRGERAVV